MKIGIDFRPALMSRAGIGRYTRGLVGGLGRLGSPVQFELYAHLVRRGRTEPGFRLGSGMRLHRGPVPARLLHVLGSLGYGCECHFGKVDLFHFTDFASLPFRRTPHVFTLHDVSFLVNPSWHEARAVEALREVTGRLVGKARIVFVHSHHTAREVAGMLKVEPDRIRVAPPGVGLGFFRDVKRDAIESVHRRLGLPPSYCLSLGTLEPRKNLPRLIRAFGRMHGHHPGLGLVLAGARGWLEKEVFAAVEMSPCRDCIHVVGQVEEGDLPALYRGASAFAYVSLYEGFGLPVLEALASGVPAVVSRAASLPEAAGPAAVLVDPQDEAAIADALHRVLTEEPLREGLRRAGVEHARTFTWERTARITLDGYREAVS